MAWLSGFACPAGRACVGWYPATWNGAEVMVTPELVVLPLTVRDLAAADLPACAWSGGPLHIAAIAEALDRAARGEVD